MVIQWIKLKVTSFKGNELSKLAALLYLVVKFSLGAFSLPLSLEYMRHSRFTLHAIFG
jgi:hypothetical protein